MLDVTKLNPYSKVIYALIEESYPEWVGLAKPIELEEGAFEIKIPSPAGIPLEICTCNNEVTVSFGMFHDHFDAWSGRNPDNVYMEAKPFVGGIKNGRIFIASVFENGKLCYSTMVNSSDLEQFRAKFKGSNRQFQIVGWNNKI